MSTNSHPRYKEIFESLLCDLKEMVRTLELEEKFLLSNVSFYKEQRDTAYLNLYTGFHDATVVDRKRLEQVVKKYDLASSTSDDLKNRKAYWTFNGVKICVRLLEVKDKFVVVQPLDVPDKYDAYIDDLDLIN